MINNFPNTEIKYLDKIKTGLYFTVVSIGAFAVTYLILYMFWLVPESLGGRTKKINENYISEYWLGDYNPITSSNIDQASFTTPDRIVINKVGINTKVEKPSSRDVNVLDQYLTRGAVYYPGSGSIEKGNIFIFGHSSNLAVVRNQSYKTFNGIEKLKQGDEIIAVAGEAEYVYKVNSVRLLDANETQINFDNTKRLLTLTTCNTFGAKQERWVVESEFYSRR